MIHNTLVFRARTPLIEAGKLLGAGTRWVVLDHLIIGQGRWVSLRERRLGFSA